MLSVLFMMPTAGRLISTEGKTEMKRTSYPKAKKAASITLSIALASSMVPTGAIAADTTQTGAAEPTEISTAVTPPMSK